MEIEYVPMLLGAWKKKKKLNGYMRVGAHTQREMDFYLATHCNSYVQISFTKNGK